MEKDLELRVTEILLELGIPANIRGYRYAREGIMLAAMDMSVMGAVTKKLYPKIAEKFNSTPAKVERAMRHAITIAWGRGNLEATNKYFKNTLSPKKTKPTNSEFVALLADTISIELRLADCASKR